MLHVATSMMGRCSETTFVATSTICMLTELLLCDMLACCLHRRLRPQHAGSSNAQQAAATLGMDAYQITGYAVRDQAPPPPNPTRPTPLTT